MLYWHDLLVLCYRTMEAQTTDMSQSLSLSDTDGSRKRRSGFNAWTHRKDWEMQSRVTLVKLKFCIARLESAESEIAKVIADDKVAIGALLEDGWEKIARLELGVEELEETVEQRDQELVERDLDYSDLQKRAYVLATAL